MQNAAASWARAFLALELARVDCALIQCRAIRFGMLDIYLDIVNLMECLLGWGVSRIHLIRF